MPLLIVVQVLDLGLGGIWAGIAAFIAVRMLFGAVRWRSRRWLVAGTLMVDELPHAEVASPEAGCDAFGGFSGTRDRECQLRTCGIGGTCL